MSEILTTNVSDTSNSLGAPPVDYVVACYRAARQVKDNAQARERLGGLPWRSLEELAEHMDSLAAALSALREANKGCGAQVSSSIPWAKCGQRDGVGYFWCRDCAWKRDQAVLALTTTPGGQET